MLYMPYSTLFVQENASKDKNVPSSQDFAISEMYRICLCTNGVAPRVPYPLEVPEVR